MAHQTATGQNFPPRVLIFPFPAQGHVNCMLQLAELLGLAGIHVTFLNTNHVHRRLLQHADIQARFAAYPGFLFRTISDGLPEDDPRSGNEMRYVLRSMLETTKPVLKDMLSTCGDILGSDSSPYITCIIADGIFGSLANELGNELNIPVIHFRTISACCFWIYFSVPDIIKAEELPIREKEDMDRMIRSVAGMETFLRCRDLPSFCQVSDERDPQLHLVARETRQSARAQSLILNTYEDLEGPLVSHIRTHCPKIYTIGPLHAHLKVRLAKNVSTSTYTPSSNSIFEVDGRCMAWLDSQPFKSVIYVSFGSITVMKRDTLMEFWHGLVNSNKRFLWVVRPDMVAGEVGNNEIPAELVAATRERGYLVGWVPQEEVLAHRAVGGFLTHSGWNSTLESIVAEVPMICWAYFADQPIISRYVGEVWKLGMDMKGVCDRKIVEKMVNDLMVERREDFARSTAEMARLARKSVNEGGSSYCNLDRLIADIRLTSMGKSAP
ncbi:UDP-glucuronosyl/UDP-glucosyltransferase [Parasponia andersonii]|uniref:Glycosyltransferase n=1 Tax=Parasponia andersonii TaxID=3476 RepID=A0A2P5C620_PARAD|nr:UDP-glucuronosyl/UDP-glucosyltransferase [Parasponia andersonii]